MANFQDWSICLCPRKPRSPHLSRPGASIEDRSQLYSCSLYTTRYGRAGRIRSAAPGECDAGDTVTQLRRHLSIEHLKQHRALYLG
jgi:hypothetical protein